MICGYPISDAPVDSSARITFAFVTANSLLSEFDELERISAEAQITANFDPRLLLLTGQNMRLVFAVQITVSVLGE